jgi:hypothetical protein
MPLPKSLATLICEHLAQCSEKFNPNTEISEDTEQFLSVNITANHDRLERWVAYVLQEAYMLGAEDATPIKIEEYGDSRA